MSLTRIIDPAVEPLSIDEARSQARLDGASDQDLDLLEFLRGARDQAEQFTRRALITQTWRLTIDNAFPDTIELWRTPVQSITSITYLDSDSVEQTVDSSLYQSNLTVAPAIIKPTYNGTWPTPYAVLGAVNVTFVAGYGDAPYNVPPMIRMALRALIASCVDYRDATSADWDGFYQRLMPFKVWRLP